MTEFVIIFVIFLSLCIIGMPVFLSMGVAGFIGIYLVEGTIAAAVSTLPLVANKATGDFTLIAVPLFVFAGCLMHYSGISKDLFDFSKTVVGGLRNGLAIAVIVACAIFAAISGSSVATAAGLGIVALPVLKDQGYSDNRRGGLLAAGGTLGILIPPSIIMILYGSITETSVGKLFMAGLLPGILLASLFSMYLLLIDRPGVKGVPCSLKLKLTALVRAVWALGMPASILAAIYTGLATPTEIGALACIYAMIVGIFVYRSLGVRQLWEAVIDTALTTSMISMLVFCGLLMARYITLIRLPDMITEAIKGYGMGSLGVLSLMLLIYFILGCVLEATSMLLITVPVFFPIVRSYGIDALYFGVFVTICIEMAQITPPVGINLYVISGIGKIKIEKMVFSIIPYVICMIIAIYVVYFVPFLYRVIPGAMR